MHTRFGWPAPVRPSEARGRTALHALALGLALLCGPGTAPGQQLEPAWVLSTIAGNGKNAYSGDGGPATSASTGAVHGIAVDKLGNVYFSDNTNNVIRRVDAITGLISTIAGDGTAGYAGDGGAATAAELNEPQGLAIDNDGNLLIADYDNEIIRKVDLTTGIISTVAGTPGKAGNTGNGGPATSAQLHLPIAVATDGAGNIYIADYDNSEVRRVSPGTNGIISAFAGTGTKGNTTTAGAPAVSSEIGAPYGVWADAGGNVLIADASYSLIREVNPAGLMTTIAGTGSAGHGGDGGPATAAQLDTPRNAVEDYQGNIYICDETNHAIRRIDVATGIITTIAGQLARGGSTGNDVPGTAGQLDYPYQIAITAGNDIYIAGTTDYNVRRLTLNREQPATAVGAASAAQPLYLEASQAVTPATAMIAPPLPEQFELGAPGCTLNDELAADAACTLPVTFTPAWPGAAAAQLVLGDSGGNLTPVGLYGTGVAPLAAFSLARITTLTGDGTAGTGPGEVSAPRGGTVDAAGNLYLADSGDNVIRRISPTGEVSIVAGTGTAGYAGDGGAPTSAQLNAPSKVALDAAGNLYIADTGNNVIRFVDAATGLLSTVAGTGTAGYTGDGGLPTSAQLNAPQGIAVDAVGHVYVADTGNHVIRIFGVGGIIGTIAGSGTQGYQGDGSAAAAAAVELNGPTAVAVDAIGDVYIADTGNDVIRVIRSPTSDITTFAGAQGVAANAGDLGPATAATLDQPTDVALDAAGDLYIAAGGQVRIVNTAGIITTLAGTGAAGVYSGEGGPATSAVLPPPASNLILDGAGNLYISDTGGNRVLEVTSTTPAAIDLGVQAAGTTGPVTTFSLLNAGNSALTLGGIAATAGFELQTGAASACTTATTLAPGQSCSIGLAFSPPAGAGGALSGTLTLTDNTLNGSSVGQLFPLSGATAQLAGTTTTVTTLPAAPVYGSPAMLSATVAGGSSPTGTVQFTVDGIPAGSASVSGGVATIALPAAPAGDLSVGAAYSGDASNDASAGAGIVAVQSAVLTVTANNATMGQGTSAPQSTYTITGFVNGDTQSVVTGVPAESTPAGPASAQGTYPITISQGTLAAANYSFTFVNGTMTVGPTPAVDFLLGVTPATVSLPSSQPYIATVILTPLYNYTGTAKLSCTSAPAGLGCTAGGVLTGGGGPLTGNAQGAPVYQQITITGAGGAAGPASARGSRPPESGGLWLAIGLPVCLFGCAFGRRRRGSRAGGLLALALLALLAAGAVSCGRGAGTVAAGSYQVTVTATDTSSPGLTHSVILTINYQ